MCICILVSPNMHQTTNPVNFLRNSLRLARHWVRDRFFLGLAPLLYVVRFQRETKNSKNIAQWTLRHKQRCIESRVRWPVCTWPRSSLIPIQRSRPCNDLWETVWSERIGWFIVSVETRCPSMQVGTIYKENIFRVKNCAQIFLKMWSIKWFTRKQGTSPEGNV